MRPPTTQSRGSRPKPQFRLGELIPRAPRGPAAGLPPGQRAVPGFFRYGTHFHQPDPAPPTDPAIEVVGPGIEPVVLDTAALGELPRVDLVTDFHCVAGWTARDVNWSGVRFRDLYERVTAARAEGAPAITHVRPVGSDGFRSVVALEDALADDVLIADRLGGEPLPLEHGGPLRFVSPSQYGYKSVKYVRRIELHAGEPPDLHMDRLTALMLRFVAQHPRARVMHEERHARLPAWAVRRLYIRVIHPFVYVLSHLGGRRSPRG